MSVYVPQTKAPKKGNPYYDSDKNIFHASGFPRPNCTTQVEGEWMERYGVPTGCLSCAGGWIDDIKKYNLKWKVSQTPALGAIAVWKIQGTKEDGHVATTEQIFENVDINTSNSAYKGTMWWLERFKAGFNYNWTSKITGKKYIFQGFILPPVEQKEQPATLHATARIQFRRNPDDIGNRFDSLNKGDEFLYDGTFKIVKNTKWLRGIHSGVLGWASARFLR